MGISDNITFPRSVEDVVDLLADPRNEPAYNPVILSAETANDPIGVGSRFTQRAKSFGQVGETVRELIRYQRPGCVVSWTWDVRQRGAWRLLGPLVGRAGCRLERRDWKRMKDYVDSAAAGPQHT